MQISLTYCDERGAGWIAATPAYMRRASHALATEDGVWLVDPVDGDGLRDILAPLGDVRGVIQLCGRHARDCAALAARLSAPHLVTPFAGVAGSPFEVVTVLDRPWWREVALWWSQQRTLIVPEALGTAPYYRMPGAELGVHPALRLTPPRALVGFDAARLLPGHGAPVEGAHVAGAIRDAVDRSRREIPALYARLARHGGRPPG